MTPASIFSITDLYGGIGFCLIGCLTWFFSSRRRLLIRTFIRSPIVRGSGEATLPQNPHFRRSLRFIAILQMLTGAALAMVEWLAG
jgi:hypothetical protein